MKALLTSVFVLLLHCYSIAQIIPPDRFYDWSKAGLNDTQPDITSISINIKDLGAANDGSSSVNSFIQSAIDSLNGRFGILYFPAGTYLVNASLVLPDSVVLKGTSSDSTTLVFVGNEITNTTALYGNYLMAGTGQFEYGNNVKGTITPSGTSPLNDSTYYLQSKPAFWDSTKWVTIGIPNTIGSGTIPAQQRFLDSLLLTVCALIIDSVPVDTIPDTTTAVISNFESEHVLLYPNPADEEVFIKINSSNRDIEILLTDLTGKLLLRKQFELHGAENLLTFDLSEIKSPGLYFIEVHGKTTIIKKLFIQ